MTTLLIQIAVAAATAALLVPLLRQRLSTGEAAWRAGVLSAVTTVVLTPALVLGPVGPDMYTPKAPVFILKYLAAYLPVWAVIVMIALASTHMLRVHRERHDVGRFRRVLIAIWCTVSIGLGGLLIFLARWVTDYFGQIDIDEVVFTLVTGRDHNTNDLTMEVMHYVVAPVVCCVIAGLIIGTWDLRASLGAPGHRVLRVSARWIRTAGAALGAVVLAVGGHMIAQAVPIADLLFPPAQTTFIEEEYVSPSEVTLTYPDHPRNLIHIMVESLEATFYDTAQGGAMRQDLLPDLAQLSDENLSFSNSDLKGGFHQTRGATFTTGGLVTMTTGVPLKAPMLDADIQTFVFPDFTSIGDLLASQGYTNELITGANADFGSKRAFFTDHGHFRILDHARAIELGLIPADYAVNWGFEDAKVFSYAQQEATNLAASGRPFYLMVETANTHFPGGYVPDDATDLPFSEHYANALYLSQREIVDFVRWAQGQSWYPDTTIIITGDHNTMETDFFDAVGLDPAYDRTVVDIIVNPAPGLADLPAERFHNRQAATFDMFPTTLAALGIHIDGERLGLGTNLFSGQPTLMERDGVEQVRTSLEAPSRFYDSHVHTH